MLHVAQPTRSRDGVDPRDFEYTALALHTTGPDPAEGARVCEIAAVRFDPDGAVIEEFSTLLNPGRHLDGADDHGITDADVWQAPVFADVAGTLLRLLRGAVAVCHDAVHTDLFLSAELARLGVADARVTCVDTQALAKAQLDLRTTDLPSLARAVGGAGQPECAGAALPDARTAARVLTALFGHAPLTLPVVSLADDFLPLRPEADRVRPRALAVRKGTDGWIANMVRTLPATAARSAFDGPAAERYRTELSRLVGAGRITSTGAGQLSAYATRAGFDQHTIRLLHTQLVRTAKEGLSAGAPLADLKELHAVAEDLDARHMVADLPAVTRELKGWRIVAVGDDPKVLELAAWAERHGAQLGKQASKTTKLVIVPFEGMEQEVPMARQHRVPVMDPAAAETELRKAVDAARDGGGGVPEADVRRLVFPAAQVAPVWRAEELEQESPFPAQRLESAAADGWAEAPEEVPEKETECCPGVAPGSSCCSTEAADIAVQVPAARQPVKQGWLTGWLRNRWKR